MPINLSGTSSISLQNSDCQKQPLQEISMSSCDSTAASTSAETHSSIFTRSSTKNFVSFAHVEIRNYAVTVGDNPSCLYGPAISFDWEYTQHKSISIDDFEKLRSKSRLHEGELYMTSRVRQSILKMWNVSEEEISTATDKREKIISQRYETKQQELRKMRKERRIKKIIKRISGGIA